MIKHAMAMDVPFKIAAAVVLLSFMGCVTAKRHKLELAETAASVRAEDLSSVSSANKQREKWEQEYRTLWDKYTKTLKELEKANELALRCK